MINVLKLCILPKSQNQPFAGGNTLHKADVLWKTTHWGEAKPQHSLWRIYVQRASRVFWARRAQAEKQAALGRKAQIASRSVCCAPWEVVCAGLGFSSWSVGGVLLSPHALSLYPQAVCLNPACSHKWTRVALLWTGGYFFLTEYFNVINSWLERHVASSSAQGQHVGVGPNPKAVIARGSRVCSVFLFFKDWIVL